MIVQIYEIQDPREAETCVSLGVDRIGSVLLSGDSWRSPAIRDVCRLTEGTATKNSLIPLFQEEDTLYRALDYYRPHYVHFCDSLTDSSGRPVDPGPMIERQIALKERFPHTAIIRTIPVPRDGEVEDFPVLETARVFEACSDWFLIDTWLGREPVEGFVGITGKTCDRERAGRLVKECPIPVILAGGLSPDNVYESLMAVTPAGADSCTGTNSVDGDGNPIRFRKDFEKVRKFVTEVRRAEEEIRLMGEGMRTRLEALEGELREREALLPPHSVRPHQIAAIETLEDEIALLREELNRLDRPTGQ